jgi:benzodiazapine receptor
MKILKILFVFTPLILGFSISLLYTADGEWYRNLKKPELIPPSIAFSIVWSILYLLFGISMYYSIYNKSYWYWIIPVVHLALNLSFTPVMFGANNLLLAFIITILTLFTSLMIILQFYVTKNIMSIFLLIPYVLWLVFASYLAYDIYKLNDIEKNSSVASLASLY